MPDYLQMMRDLAKQAGKSIEDKEVPDAVEPTTSPLDFLPYARMASLGADAVGAAVRSPLVANEVGAVGSNIGKLLAPAQGVSQAGSNLSAIEAKLVPLLKQKGLISEAGGSIADKATIAKHLQDVAQRGADTGLLGQLDVNLAAQKAGQTTDQLAQNAAQSQVAADTKQRFADLVNKLK